MKYAYIDGDDIGLRIEKCFMDNDENTLTEINSLINNVISLITNYLFTNGSKIIFSGADGIICKSPNLDPSLIHDYINTNSPDINFSIGVGESLQDAFLALRYAKSNGKNKVVILSQKGFVII